MAAPCRCCAPSAIFRARVTWTMVALPSCFLSYLRLLPIATSARRHLPKVVFQIYCKLPARKEQHQGPRHHSWCHRSGACRCESPERALVAKGQYGANSSSCRLQKRDNFSQHGGFHRACRGKPACSKGHLPRGRLPEKWSQGDCMNLPLGRRAV